MAAKLLIATMLTQTKAGKLVRRGEVVSSDEVDYDAKTSTNLIPAPSGADEVAVVEVSAIAPTGPNPTAPQQIGPGSRQTTDGYVNSEGAQLVGEVTAPAKVRIKDAGIDKDSDAEAKIAEALAKHEAKEADAANEARKAATPKKAPAKKAS